jgi:hypothetical protein
LAIIDPAQVSQGMYSLPSLVVGPAWHDLQPFAVSIGEPLASPPGGVPAPAAARAVAIAATSASAPIRLT